MPKMKHESGGRQIEVAPDMVPMYESQGWQKVTTSTSTSSKTTDAKSDTK